MITEEMIARINELARKVKNGETLTDQELAERDMLRRTYIDAFKANLRAQLENIEFVDSPDATPKTIKETVASIEEEEAELEELSEIIEEVVETDKLS
ncbi:MAG: DUF896 domain-containing protein [Firmicutes bacterium]|nr:DUF896 domain-containing protein [Bacillota bacterium]